MTNVSRITAKDILRLQNPGLHMIQTKRAFLPSRAIEKGYDGLKNFVTSLGYVPYLEIHSLKTPNFSKFMDKTLADQLKEPNSLVSK